MKKIVLSICTACLITITGFAQIDYPIFRDSSTFNPADSGRLSLEIDNLNYLRNYEFFGKIPLSYTLLGYQLIPQLKYQLNPYFTLKAGVMLRREDGRPGFYSIDPVLTAKYQKKGVSLILGALEGSLNHRFIEPIYSVESLISDRLEQGTQVILDKKKFWMDWYIDWEKAILINSSYPEELTSGVSARIKPVDNDKFSVEFPLQVMLAHKGGQIDTSSAPIETLMNTAAGASFTFKTPGSSFLTAIKTEHYFVYYKNLSGVKVQLYNEGTGWYSDLIFKSKWNLDLDLRYWKGNQFIGPRGGIASLYNSVSAKIPGYKEKERELIFASIIYDKKLFKNLYVDFRLEPYYDIKNSMLEYSYSVFLRFKKDFTLARLK
jgi:hypothetical protein